MLTRPLVYPLLAQFVGIILWIGLAYGATEIITTRFPAMNTWLVWGLFVLSNLPGFLLFINGFWNYLVWIAALNLVIRELCETGQCTDTGKYALRIRNRATDYSLIWTFLFALLFVPIGVSLIPLAFTSAHPDASLMLFIVAGILFVVGMLAATVMMVLFALVFQVFAYTPGPAGASLFRSMDLVGQSVVKTVFFILLSAIMTQFALPTLINRGLELMQIIPLLSGVMDTMVQYVLKQAMADITRLQTEYPLLTTVFNMIMADPKRLATELTLTVAYTFVSALLLPLGTCWFALLYADLKTRYEVSDVALDMMEEVHPVL